MQILSMCAISNGVQTTLRVTVLWLVFTVLPLNTVRAEAAPDHRSSFAGPGAVLHEQITSQTIEVLGQNDPAQDFLALQSAVEQARPGDTVRLVGVFDLTGCGAGIGLTKNITITGASNPNEAPADATRIRGCGPVFIVNHPVVAEGALTIQSLYFHGQLGLSVSLRNSVNPVLLLNNRFTGNTPLSLQGTMIRFAVGAAEVGPITVSNTITVEDNYIDWSDAPANETFAGDDNGFAFAAGAMSLIIRNNYINTLGEAIEIEGNTGQANSYLVEGNIVQTHVPPSPAGESNGPPGSVAAGFQGGHPAAIKLHANEGSLVVRDNVVTLTGLTYGVCIMATTLHPRALAGEQVHLIEHNQCTMAGQVTAILGAWGQTQPFFEPAFLSGAVVSANVISGTGSVGIAMIDRTAAPLLSSVVNYGRDNHFLLNDFTNFTATRADIGLDQETSNNLVTAWPDDQIIDLGDNQVFTQRVLMPLIIRN